MVGAIEKKKGCLFEEKRGLKLLLADIATQITSDALSLLSEHAFPISLRFPSRECGEIHEQASPMKKKVDKSGTLNKLKVATTWNGFYY